MTLKQLAEKHADDKDKQDFELIARSFKTNCQQFKSISRVPIFNSLRFECESFKNDFLTNADANKFLCVCMTAPETCRYNKNSNKGEITMENTTIAITPKEKAAELTSRINANSAVAVQTLVSIGRDLKTMRDEKLYLELGCSDFGEYCDKHTQVRQRQAYNFIKCYEKYGERLPELSGLGITKLALMSALEDEDREQLIESGEAEKLSTRELEKRIEELNNKFEQLTIQLDEATEDKETAEGQLEALNKQIKELTAALDKAETRNKELENRPVEVAVQKPSEEEIKKIKDEAQKAAKKAADAAEKQHKKELDKIRAELQAQYDESVAENIKVKNEEIERLKSENATLQANAKKAAPDDTKTRVKFYLSEIQSTFNAAIETVRAVENDEEKQKYKAAFNSVIEQLGSIVEGI